MRILWFLDRFLLKGSRRIQILLLEAWCVGSVSYLVLNYELVWPVCPFFQSRWINHQNPGRTPKYLKPGL